MLVITAGELGTADRSLQGAPRFGTFQPPAQKGEIRNRILCGFLPLFSRFGSLAHDYTFGPATAGAIVKGDSSPALLIVWVPPEYNCPKAVP
jgi:hypothetical protein